MFHSLPQSCVLAFTLVVSVVYGVFLTLEPRVVVGAGADDSIVVSQSVNSIISLTDPANISMSRTLGSGATTSVGTTTWNAKTNNPTGYQLKLSASSNATSTCRAGTNPTKGGALCDTAKSHAFYDVSTTTPKVWSLARNASDYSFGFSAFGTDVINVSSDEYAATGVSGCSTGSGHVINTTLKYRGFEGSNQFVVATKNTETSLSGASTTICLAVDQGGAIFAPSGTYQATTTATLTTI